MIANDRVPLHRTKEEGDAWKLERMRAAVLRCYRERQKFPLGSLDRTELLETVWHARSGCRQLLGKPRRPPLPRRSQGKASAADWPAGPAHWGREIAIAEIKRTWPVIDGVMFCRFHFYQNDILIQEADYPATLTLREADEIGTRFLESAL